VYSIELGVNFGNVS